ncbi:hypothetical protein [Gemmatimonas sp.]|uniref:hypothetical protein n=1 Tax=Gemmatimonas sp. TaxID=1962908 RepID=UPI00286E9E80|nr:hypothetical protein [Gemmatimonas sp.]
MINIYGAGHIVQAQSTGIGLAFAEIARPNWHETMELRTLRADASSAALPDAHGGWKSGWVICRIKARWYIR